MHCKESKIEWHFVKTNTLTWNVIGIFYDLSVYLDECTTFKRSGYGKRSEDLRNDLNHTIDLARIWGYL